MEVPKKWMEYVVLGLMDGIPSSIQQRAQNTAYFAKLRTTSGQESLNQDNHPWPNQTTTTRDKPIAIQT